MFFQMKYYWVPEFTSIQFPECTCILVRTISISGPSWDFDSKWSKSDVSVGYDATPVWNQMAMATYHLDDLVQMFARLMGWSQRQFQFRRLGVALESFHVSSDSKLKFARTSPSSHLRFVPLETQFQSPFSDLWIHRKYHGWSSHTPQK